MDKWISVSERLPDEPDFHSNVLPTDVLVWERHYSYKVEDYVEGYNIGWCWRGTWVVNGGGECEVLAWKPLPKRFNESEEKNG